MSVSRVIFKKQMKKRWVFFLKPEIKVYPKKWPLSRMLLKRYGDELKHCKGILIKLTARRSDTQACTWSILFNSCKIVLVTAAGNVHVWTITPLIVWVYISKFKQHAPSNTTILHIFLKPMTEFHNNASEHNWYSRKGWEGGVTFQKLSSQS